MRRALGGSLLALVLAGCGRLNDVQYEPPTTPEEWCAQRPCVDVGGVVLTEPLGTVLVVTLTLLWFGVGAGFLVTRRGQTSRGWLGAALVLGGVGAAQAAVSYQAFSYELKCAGKQLCTYTNGFEVGYSVTTAWSVSAMLIAVGYACAVGRTRRGVIIYAALNAVAYSLVALAGVLSANVLLLSFEVLMVFALPGLLLVIVLSARSREPASRSILWAAVLLLVVNVAYFAYYAAGVTQALWDGGEGFYFSANEVLHVGMIGWLVFVAVAVGPRLSDREGSS